MDKSKTTDERLIADMLTYVGKQDFPAITGVSQALTSLLERIHAGHDEEAILSEEFANLIRTTPNLWSEASVCIAERAIQFINEQIVRFTELKTKRPFTDDELQFGRTQLLPMLKSLGDLFKA
jgi:hypothetical protein